MSASLLTGNEELLQALFVCHEFVSNSGILAQTRAEKHCAHTKLENLSPINQVRLIQSTLCLTLPLLRREMQDAWFCPRVRRQSAHYRTALPKNRAAQRVRELMRRHRQSDLFWRLSAGREASRTRLRDRRVRFRPLPVGDIRAIEPTKCGHHPFGGCAIQYAEHRGKQMVPRRFETPAKVICQILAVVQPDIR